jgi:hypothetical protein
MGDFYYPMPIKSMFENFPVSKFVYDSPLYYIVASQTSNSNNSANLKQSFKIFLVVYQGPRWSCSMKMNEGEKSRDTVPLRLTYYKYFLYTVHCCLSLPSCKYFLHTVQCSRSLPFCKYILL